MLSVCTAEGCTTIVFGRGTCVEHDRARTTMADRFLADALTRTGTAQRLPETLDAS